MNILSIFIYIITLSYSVAEKPTEKLNIIIFFTEATAIPSSDVGIKFLDMHEVVRVKHNTNTKTAGNYNIHRRNTENCKELLKESLDLLVRYCKHALGMKTVTLSISDYVSEDTNFHSSDHIVQRQSKNTPPKHKKVKNGRRKQKEDTIPSVIKMNNMNPNAIISTPEHTEVFNIRLKRNISEHQDDSDNFLEYPKKNKPEKYNWDILDIMSHVRLSFFGDFFNNERDKLAKEENNILPSLNKPRYNFDLFNAVSNALDTLQEPPCDGFLMVIFGSHLDEISDTRSPLIQSIKHITETTNEQNTLIVLTTACPKMGRSNNEVVEIKEDAKKINDIMVLPVFAKGPKSSKLMQCSVLYDIPLTLKNILEEMSPTFTRI
ncbi:uncharacterized protein LOC114332710 [Diabrotica virgifera virgifera]|uniref:Uncharacterized protein LOC114332710 n=1 Tax=Diabrotica virgifera virgifera TaxID=50390 RepID=A0A6P7FU53_DIAVI|nr:uncharacterized protein LOC114332710 [Diabrotica virgifera virgifera]